MGDQRPQRAVFLRTSALQHGPPSAPRANLPPRPQGLPGDYPSRGLSTSAPGPGDGGQLHGSMEQTHMCRRESGMVATASGWRGGARQWGAGPTASRPPPPNLPACPDTMPTQQTQRQRRQGGEAFRPEGFKGGEGDGSPYHTSGTTWARVTPSKLPCLPRRPVAGHSAPPRWKCAWRWSVTGRPHSRCHPYFPDTRRSAPQSQKGGGVSASSRAVGCGGWEKPGWERPTRRPKARLEDTGKDCGDTTHLLLIGSTPS